MKILVTPFDKQEAFKYGIIDKNGKVLRKQSTIIKPQEKSLIQFFIDLFLI